MNKQAQFDLGCEFDGNYKSCFARSMAVNSQYKQTKSLDFIHPQQDNNSTGDAVKKPCGVNRPVAAESQEVVRLRKVSFTLLFIPISPTIKLKQKGICNLETDTIFVSTTYIHICNFPK